MPQPPGQRVQAEFSREYAPSLGTGVHGQFCVQIDKSSVIFQGNGDRVMPTVVPRENDKKHLLLSFMDITSLRESASYFDLRPQQNDIPKRCYL
jgi:hypothetical protein